MSQELTTNCLKCKKTDESEQVLYVNQYYWKDQKRGPNGPKKVRILTLIQTNIQQIYFKIRQVSNINGFQTLN